MCTDVLLFYVFKMLTDVLNLNFSLASKYPVVSVSFRPQSIADKEKREKSSARMIHLVRI